MSTPPMDDFNFDYDPVSKLVNSLLLANGSPAMKETLLQWLDLATHQWWSKPSPLHCRKFLRMSRSGHGGRRGARILVHHLLLHGIGVRMIPPIRYEVPLKEGASAV